MELSSHFHPSVPIGNGGNRLQTNHGAERTALTERCFVDPAEVVVGEPQHDGGAKCLLMPQSEDLSRRTGGDRGPGCVEEGPGAVAESGRRQRPKRAQPERAFTASRTLSRTVRGW